MLGCWATLQITSRDLSKDSLRLSFAHPKPTTQWYSLHLLTLSTLLNCIFTASAWATTIQGSGQLQTPAHPQHVGISITFVLPDHQLFRIGENFLWSGKTLQTLPTWGLCHIACRGDCSTTPPWGYNLPPLMCKAPLVLYCANGSSRSTAYWLYISIAASTL